MTALSLAVVLALVQPAKEYKVRTVTAEVAEARFAVLGMAKGLTVLLNVSEKDPRWKDRDLSLHAAKLVVDGKEGDLSAAVTWLATPAKVDASKKHILESVEVTATISDNPFVGVTKAEFRRVPWDTYHPAPKAEVGK